MKVSWARRWREALPPAFVVLVVVWLISRNLEGLDRDTYLGTAFLAAAIAYAIYANRRSSLERLAREPTFWGMARFAIGLIALNFLFAALMEAAAAIVGTVLLVGAYFRCMWPRSPERTPVRRLLVAFAFSLLPLGWLSYDYWNWLRDEHELAEEAITADLRAQMKPVLAALDADFEHLVEPIFRRRRSAQTVAARLAEMSRLDVVEWAFFLPSRPIMAHSMYARRGEPVPAGALPRGVQRVIAQVGERFGDELPRTGRRTHSAVFQSDHAGYANVRMESVGREGHWGVLLSFRHLVDRVAAHRLERAGLSGRVKIVLPERERPGEVVLLTQDAMPDNWGFAKAVIEPAAFARTKAVVDRVRTLGQAWFAVLVVWLAASFLNMYRTATRDMALAEMKSTFVSSVTHELKTPLGMIRMYSEMLQLGLVGAGKKPEDYLRIITGEADRLARLIENVLDFSQIQRGAKAFQFQGVDLREVAETALRNLEAAFSAAGKAVSLEAPDGLVVRADRDAALQALLNLLSNAIKYGGPHVRVAASRVGPELRLAVHDDGPGIPPAERDKVFQPFYRVGGDSERAAEGTGLGLALAMEVMRAHHGTVRLSGEPGQGTTFTLAFPDPATFREVAA